MKIRYTTGARSDLLHLRRYVVERFDAGPVVTRTAEIDEGRRSTISAPLPPAAANRLRRAMLRALRTRQTKLKLSSIFSKLK